jgi:SAM-dependent methyltransferase
MSRDAIYEKEKEFHNNRFKNEDTRKNLDKYYVITTKVDQYINSSIGFNCKNKKLLDYGCSLGEESIFWAKKGAIVTGIDISSEAIKKAEISASNKSLKIKFLVDNAENTSFSSKSFDLIIGRAILHHLDLRSSYAELSRLIKNDGRVVFLEPLGHNPLINLFRRLTPKLRTEDEHPFTMSDLTLLHEYFNNVNLKYFNFFTIALVPFRNFFFFSALYNALSRLDNFLLKYFPYSKKYFWMVVISLSSPKI